MARYYSDTTSERVFIDEIVDGNPLVLPRVTSGAQTASTYDPTFTQAFSTNTLHLSFEFDLPVAAVPGTVNFTFTKTQGQTDERSPHIATLPSSFESAGKHGDAFTNAQINLTDLRDAGPGAAVVDSVYAKLVPGAVYTITLSYVDSFVGIVRSVSTENYLYDPNKQFTSTGTASVLQWKDISFADMFKWGGVDIPAFASKIKKVMDPFKTFMEIFKILLGILKVFLVNYKSSAAILEAIISQVESTIKELAENIGASGVYSLVICPPLPTDKDGNKKLGSYAKTALTVGYDGGYDGFISKVKAATANYYDPNRPNFNDDAIVGGCVLMVDTESLADLIAAWNLLVELLFPDFPMIQYPAPTNIVAYPGFFLKSDGTPLTNFNSDGKPVTVDKNGYELEISEDEYERGIKLEWDAPPGYTPFLRSGFKVFRSTGTKSSTTIKVPQIGTSEYKEIQVPIAKVYDELKDDGHYIVSQRRGWYVDTFPVSTPGTTYFYVIKTRVGKASNGVSTYGVPSYEVSSSFVECVDPNSAVVIYHEEGDPEYISSGDSGIPEWSSIRVGDIPIFLDVIDYLNRLMSILSGWVKTSSTALKEFIDGLMRQIDALIKIVDQIIKILEIIERLTALPSINFLYVPAQLGGLNNFVGRIVSAKHPQAEDWDPNSGTPEPHFSGPNGFTAGTVFLFGIPGASVATSAITALENKKEGLQLQLDGLKSGESTNDIEDQIHKIDDILENTPDSWWDSHKNDKIKLETEKFTLEVTLLKERVNLVKQILQVQMSITLLEVDLVAARADYAVAQLGYGISQKVIGLLGDLFGGKVIKIGK